MQHRLVTVALVFASLGFAACTIERAPAASPAAPAAPAAPPAAAPAETVVPVAPMVALCKPIGLWRVSGPAGSQEVKVSASIAKPGAYDVSYKGATVGNGVGVQEGAKLSVNLGQATGGLYNCVQSLDCKTLSCGFAGQPPQVFTKAD